MLPAQVWNFVAKLPTLPRNEFPTCGQNMNGLQNQLHWYDVAFIKLADECACKSYLTHMFMAVVYTT